MNIEIISPESTILKANVKSVAVPGVNGEFQMLDQHAPLVSILNQGDIKIEGDLSFEKHAEALFSKATDGRWVLSIKGGTIEINNNKIIILTD